MIDTEGNFYLGRIFDQATGKVTADSLMYEPEDLTTHAVVVGMTGSGKTGLCVGLLEEAALQGLPALMIDPKGDITNMLLHFPDFLPTDFAPWVNADEARRNNKTLEQAGAEAAEQWKKGLADWNIDAERMRALRDAAHYAIYTPGSDAGIPVSILASLKAPEIPWEENRELLRERISSTVTALLGLVGLTDIDPVRSREHILLSNIFENAWSQGQDLHLDELILRTQNPPFPKLGVFDVNTFFPEKDRFELAMLLNNILAAPAFQTWIEGVPLDIPSLLFHPDGKPRHSVFYIAHLPDAERMFFITLLFSAFETWMRTQSGTTTLRALLYFDEIFGYLPPIGNPPSKQPMLRMLKQARAFGVGLVLVTQNPVDVDYKGLSNTGTWMIGKLQTERDKARLLDGLEGATAGAMDRGAYDKLISGLGKRVFLMHNVHNKGPMLFSTRWAMNYLAGPLARTQIPMANQLVGAAVDTTAVSQVRRPTQTAARPAATATPSMAAANQVAPSAAPAARSTPAASATQTPGLGSITRSPVPAGIAELFLPANLTLSEAYRAAGKSPAAGAKNLGMVYYPTILAQARVRFLNRKYNLDTEKVMTAMVHAPDRRGIVRWEHFVAPPVDPEQLTDSPDPDGRFMTLDVPFNDAKILKALEKDFIDYVFRTTTITVRANEDLKVYAGPEVSEAEFQQMCAKVARSSPSSDLKKAVAAVDRQIRSIEEKLARELRELESDQAELSSRRMEEMGTHAENVFGFLTGKKSSRRVSSSLTKRRLTAQAKADVEESEKAIDEFKRQLAELDKEKERLEAEATSSQGKVITGIEEITLTPMKKDILKDVYGVAWLPCYIIQVGGQTEALRAYGV